MNVLDLLFPARARQREELAKVRDEYARTLKERRRCQRDVAEEAASIDAALVTALEKVDRIAHNITSIAPPRNDDNDEHTGSE